MEGELASAPRAAAAFADEVVRQAAAGDAVAFTRIVAYHHDDMVRVCYVICGDSDIAQDAAQTAWSIAWRRLDSLREPERLRPWLVSIAANEARKALRHQRRATIVEISVADIGADELDPARHALASDIAGALDRLSPDERALLALRYVAGFDATEIGRSLGVSPSGIRSRLSRAAARLRSELHDA
jgi:RNA polymerase sigma factor (sigma-70 family)